MRFNEANGESFFIKGIKGFNHHQLFLSNDLRLLAKELSQNCTRENGSLFREKIVLTSTAATQHWLQRELAKTMLFNTQLYSFSRGTMEVFSRVFPYQDKRLPNRLETLILLYENLLNDRGDCLKNVQDLPSAIFTYAQLFEKYALYEERIASFLHDSESNQAQLYCKLYEQNLFISLTQWLKQKIQYANIEIHLFALPYLPPALLQFFLRLSNELPLFVYELNVCKEFWSDLLSQQELFSLEQKWQREGVSEAQIQALYDFSEAPFALANYGKLMRQGLIAWEENFVDQTEEFIVPESKEQLGIYQTSLVDFGKRVLPKKDRSIQFHAAPSSIREVEVTKSLLFQLIFKEKISPGEIKILAPQFSEYSSLIKAELGDFPLTILHEQSLIPNTSLEGLLLLLKLEENRFTKEAVLELFSYPSFAKKNELTQGDLEQISNWIENLNIRWGFNQKQKNRILRTVEHPQIDGSNTFEQGLNRLVGSIAKEELVTLSNIELVSKFYDLVHSIYESCALFFENDEVSVGELIDQTKGIFEKFFLPEEGFSFEELIHTLLPSFREKKISFALFLRYLEERIRKRAFFENQRGLDHIFCTSLLLGSQLPCKVAIVLGMHLDAFPTKEICFSHDLLLEGEGYLPSNIDYEKNSFLELLNSCTEKLVFTFIKTPSILLQELQDDLGEVTSYIHPPFCTDPSYFDSQDPYFSSPIERRETKVATVDLGEKQGKKQEILVEDLVRFLKNPLAPFFRQQGLYLKDRNQEDEEFSLSALTKTKIVRKKEDVEFLITKLKNEGAFPFHGFGQIAEQTLISGRKELEDIFAFHQINELELSSLYLTEHQTDSLEKYYHHKPLIIREKILKGQLQGITRKGVFLFEKANFEGIIRSLPSLAIVQVTGVCEPIVLFGKEQKEKKILFSDPKMFLEKLVSLYEEAHSSLLFLYPEFICPIIEKDRKKLKSKIEELCWRQYDPYLSFLVNSGHLPSLEELMDSLYEKVRECFQEIIDGHL